MWYFNSIREKATAKKLREGVFRILWKQTDHLTTEQTTVNIEEMSISFQLSYTFVYIQPSADLILEIVPLSTEILKNSKNVEYTTHLSYIVNAYSLYNKKTQMNLIDSKWKTTFLKSYYKDELAFDIVISCTIVSSSLQSKRVLGHLFNLWKTKTLADVTFRFKEKDIQAHTLILASGSPVLAAMFQNDFKEKQEGVVEIEDVDASVFDSLLRFIYTGDVDLENVDPVQLFVVADKYGVDALKEECASNLAKNLTVENVANYLELADLYPELMNRRFVRDFLQNNFKAIFVREDWEKIVKNYPEIALQAMKLLASK